MLFNKMNTLHTLALLATAFTSILAAGSQPSIKRSSNPSFKLENSQLDSGTILYFYELLGHDLKPFKEDDSFNSTNGVSPVFKKFQALDLLKVWSHRGSQPYYVQHLRIAYKVNKDISFFTSERACRLSYLKKIAPALDISERSDCKFKIAADGLSPGLNVDIFWYDNKSSNPASKALTSLDAGQESPAVTEIQFNHDFTDVMFVKTVKAGFIVTNYYAIKPDTTLITTYTLNYVYNIPPAIAGGASALRKKLVEQIPLSVERVRNYSGE